MLLIYLLWVFISLYLSNSHSFSLSSRSYSDLLDEKGYLLVNERMETKLVGLYGCGDVIKKDLRQVVTATSDGAIAAINVANYLKK